MHQINLGVSIFQKISPPPPLASTWKFPPFPNSKSCMNLWQWDNDFFKFGMEIFQDRHVSSYPPTPNKKSHMKPCQIASLWLAASLQLTNQHKLNVKWGSCYMLKRHLQQSTLCILVPTYAPPPLFLETLVCPPWFFFFKKPLYIYIYIYKKNMYKIFFKHKPAKKNEEKQVMTN